jgi:hypothetical protein
MPSMQIADFVKGYQAKSDEELIQLAAAPDQLTAEARIALHGELSRRQINIAEEFQVSQGVGDSNDAVQVAVSQRLQQGERQGVGDFVAETLRTYHADFWLYFKIAAPAVVISTFAIITSRHEVREILRHLPRGVELLAHHILEIGLINYSAWFVSWMAFSFMFGATCIAVEEKAAGFTPSAWHSWLNVRERLGSFLRVSLLLLVLVVVAEAASVLLGAGVFWALHQWKLHPSGFLITAVSYGLVGPALLIVSRFFLAVPAVVLDDCRVWPATLRSAELSRGKGLVLAALLAKSLIGGYIAGMCPFWLASGVRISVPLPSWFPWILTIASMIGVTVVEPTMFIGFALLYLKTSASDSAASKALASRLA